MSVATGVDPAALAELDGPMFDAVERAARRAWAARYELAAGLIELVAQLRREFLAAHGVKAGKLPTPTSVPRPDEAGDWLAPAPAEAPPVVSPLEFASKWGPRG